MGDIRECKEEWQKWKTEKRKQKRGQCRANVEKVNIAASGLLLFAWLGVRVAGAEIGGDAALAEPNAKHLAERLPGFGFDR